MHYLLLTEISTARPAAAASFNNASTLKRSCWRRAKWEMRGLTDPRRCAASARPSIRLDAGNDGLNELPAAPPS